MSELTVSMPTYNSGSYVKEAIESVLLQKEVDFELIVVDDNSKDNTIEIVQSIRDPRIRLFENQQHRGISYCHNLVIKESKSLFIAHVDSDDIVMPGAFRKMLDHIKSSPDIGQIHCYFFLVDINGRVTRKAFHERRKYVLDNIKPDMDYKEKLIVNSSIANGLRTFRKEVFDIVGKFDEKIKCGEDYEMALRIVDKFRIKLVPEFLYVVRLHKKNTTPYHKFREVIWWWNRFTICNRLLITNQVKFLRKKEYKLYRMLFAQLYYILSYYFIVIKQKFIKKIDEKFS